MDLRECLSLWILAPCGDCRGSGTVGKADPYSIFCERCEGTGLR